jgi:hypothetical protein
MGSLSLSCKMSIGKIWGGWKKGFAINFFACIADGLELI